MTLPSIDDTHDQTRSSWVESANGHSSFPLQNLPLGMFTLAGASTPRAGVAIGDSVVDLAALAQAGLLPEAAPMLDGDPAANALLGAAPEVRSAVRRRLCDLLDAGKPASDAARKRAGEFLHDASACRMLVPARIGSYSDFNAGIFHSARGGMRRGRSREEALLPNYRHIPIGYHGRASSVCVSDTPVRRPNGQFRLPDADAPVFGPSRKLDFELELGIWLGRNTELGEPVSIEEAATHIAGYSLLNDWSARDIQSWESERLGPFLGKSFGTTVSPWVITPEALAPFRLPAFERSGTDPRPLPYLLDEEDQRQGSLDLAFEVWLRPAGANEAVRISHSHARHLYWTPAQIVAHQASNGCNLRAGDLLGTGTITGPGHDNFGTFLDAIDAQHPVVRAGAAERTFLHDGDELTLTAHARREGFATIGFGHCRGAVVPAAPTKYRTA